MKFAAALVIAGALSVSAQPDMVSTTAVPVNTTLAVSSTVAAAFTEPGEPGATTGPTEAAPGSSVLAGLGVSTAAAATEPAGAGEPGATEPAGAGEPGATEPAGEETLFGSTVPSDGTTLPAAIGTGATGAGATTEPGATEPAGDLFGSTVPSDGTTPPAAIGTGATGAGATTGATGTGATEPASTAFAAEEVGGPGAEPGKAEESPGRPEGGPGAEVMSMSMSMGYTEDRPAEAAPGGPGGEKAELDAEIEEAGSSAAIGFASVSALIAGAVSIFVTL